MIADSEDVTAIEVTDGISRATLDTIGDGASPSSVPGPLLNALLSVGFKYRVRALMCSHADILIILGSLEHSTTKRTR